MAPTPPGFIRFSFFVLPSILSHTHARHRIDRYIVKSLVHALDSRGVRPARRGAAPARYRRADRLWQRDVLPAAAYAPSVRVRRENRRTALPPVVEISPHKRFRIGYASQGQDSSFLVKCMRACPRSRAGTSRAHRGRQPLSAEGCAAQRRAPDQGKGRSRHRVSNRRGGGAGDRVEYLEANIPFIAIDIPHPGATYFGANNYQAGLLAGRYLGK